MTDLVRRWFPGPTTDVPLASARARGGFRGSGDKRRDLTFISNERFWWHIYLGLPESPFLDKKALLPCELSVCKKKLWIRRGSPHGD